ncbi:porin family protein [Bacteroides sp.]
MINKKSIIAIVVLSLGITSPLMAQIGELRHNLAIGINGGVNLNKVTFQPKIKQNMPMGITGGLTVRYISEKYFAMICGAQLELNISQRGWDDLFETADGKKDLSRSYSREMNYLEIPFLAHLAFGREKGVQFFINLGPQIAFLVSESEKASGWTQEQINAREEYGKKIENKFDYGIAGGGGLEIRTKRAGNFLLEGRYYFGLADFYKTRKKDYFDRAAHNTISIRLTYLFDVTK